MKVSSFVILFVAFVSCISCAEEADFYTRFPQYGFDDAVKEQAALDQYVVENYQTADTVANLKNIYFLPIETGAGEEVKSNDTVVLNYTLRHLGGEEIYTTFKTFKASGVPTVDVPELFSVNSREMIAAMQYASVATKVGGTTRVIFSSQHGYGERENVHGIDKFTPLELDVQVLGRGFHAVSKSQHRLVEAVLDREGTRKQYTLTDSYILYDIILPGDSVSRVQDFQTVAVSYKMQYLNGLKTFYKEDASKGESFSFNVSETTAMPKFLECVRLLGKGGKLKAYVSGEQTTNKLSPFIYNHPLVYEIELK